MTRFTLVACAFTALLGAAQGRLFIKVTEYTAADCDPSNLTQLNAPYFEGAGIPNHRRRGYNSEYKWVGYHQEASVIEGTSGATAAWNASFAPDFTTSEVAFEYYAQDACMKSYREPYHSYKYSCEGGNAIKTWHAADDCTGGPPQENHTDFAGTWPFHTPFLPSFLLAPLTCTTTAGLTTPNCEDRMVDPVSPRHCWAPWRESSDIGDAWSGLLYVKAVCGLEMPAYTEVDFDDKSEDVNAAACEAGMNSLNSATPDNLRPTTIRPLGVCNAGYNSHRGGAKYRDIRDSGVRRRAGMLALYDTERVMEVSDTQVQIQTEFETFNCTWHSCVGPGARRRRCEIKISNRTCGCSGSATGSATKRTLQYSDSCRGRATSGSTGSKTTGTTGDSKTTGTTGTTGGSKTTGTTGTTGDSKTTGTTGGSKTTGTTANVGGSTTAVVSTSTVQLSLTVRNVTYTTLIADASLRQNFESVIKSALASQLNVDVGAITITLSAGSVVVTAAIQTNDAAAVQQLATSNTETLRTSVVTAVTNVKGISTVSKGTISASAVTIEVAVSSTTTGIATSPVAASIGRKTSWCLVSFFAGLFAVMSTAL